MVHLFDQWEKVKRKLISKHILLFFDYDGTLTPIAATPKQAVIPASTKGLLKRFSGEADYTLAIVSGRALKDIKHLVGLKNIIYVGNHGFELEGPKIKFKSWVSPRLKSIIRKIAAEAKERFLGVKGVLVEDKGLSLSIHYRLVAKNELPVFKKIFSETIKPYKASGKITVGTGKKVYEIKPPVKWNKGRVALWLLARQQFVLGKRRVFPVYFGDDLTDEDAFKALKRKGLAVFVGGPGNSKADYYLKDTKEVVKFLNLITGLNPS